MKLFIVGHGRHGKDTVAEFIRDDYDLNFQSSSMFCAEKVVRPWLAEHRGVVYATLEECYEDRLNRREDWYISIKEYNTPDLSRLSRGIFATYDMYVGIRDRDEFLESKVFSDLSIWVDASERKDYVDPTCKILKGDCDIIIDNNGTEAEAHDRITRLFGFLGFDPSSKGGSVLD